MPLITCRQCSKQLSSNAKTCPHCGLDFYRKSPVEQACRICGEVLKTDKHRIPGYFIKTEWLEGTSYDKTHLFVTHMPCPKCGEPKPLLQAGDKFTHKLLSVLLLFAVLGLCTLILGEQRIVYFAIPVIYFWYKILNYYYPALFQE